MLCTHARYDVGFGIYGLTLSKREPIKKLFHQTFTTMDPKKEKGKFPKLPQEQQLDILINYRERCLQDKDRQEGAYDFFVDSVMDYNLGKVWVNRMSTGGRF